MEYKSKQAKTILVFAFRYALGRMSTAPSYVADILKNNWKFFEDWEKKQIKEEIEYALKNNLAGMDCDRKTWEEILNLYKEEEVNEFLTNSNAIEGEFSKEALEDAKQAWTMACLSAKDGIDIDYILGIHRRLLKRLNPKIAGKIRECAVSIGGDIRGQSKEEIKLELKELCKIIPTNEEEVKDWHIKFEYTHPFQDGNGRTGRILMNIQRLSLGLQILVIHNSKKQDYYKWFQTQT